MFALALKSNVIRGFKCPLCLGAVSKDLVKMAGATFSGELLGSVLGVGRLSGGSSERGAAGGTQDSVQIADTQDPISWEPLV